jgi:hypothetical protein
MRDGKEIAAALFSARPGEKERVLHRLMLAQADRFPGSFSGEGCILQPGVPRI